MTKKKKEQTTTEPAQTAAPVSKPPVKAMKSASSDVLTLVDHDSEGNVGGILYLTKSCINRITYNVIQDLLQVFLNSPVTTTKVVTEQLLDKTNQPVNAYTKGVASITEDMQLIFQEHDTIVELINFFTDSTFTVDDYPGFTHHAELRAKFEKAKAEAKAKEEKDKKIKDLQKEIQRRNSLGMDCTEENAQLEALMGESEKPDSNLTVVTEEESL